MNSITELLHRLLGMAGERLGGSCSQARASLEGLQPAIDQAKPMVSARALAIATWQLDQAQTWHDLAQERLDEGDCSACISNTQIGLFHATLALEEIAEYHWVAAILGGRAGDSGTTGGADSSRSPAFTVMPGDAAASKGLREMRCLGLLIARAHAVHDTLIAGKHADFDAAAPLLEKARVYMEAADNADDWDDAYYAALDGRFFAELAIETIEVFLKAKGRELTMPAAAWQTPAPGSGDKDEELTYEDAQTSVRDGIITELNTRLALTALGTTIAVVTVTVDAASGHNEQAVDDYWDEKWSDAVGSGDQGYFFAHLALEVAQTYAAEVALLAANQPSTAAAEITQAEEDYCGHTDETIQSAMRRWRKTALKLAKAQALYEARCADYKEVADFLSAALEQIKKADDCSQWADVPFKLRDARQQVELALQAINSYLAGKQSKDAGEHPAS